MTNRLKSSLMLFSMAFLLITLTACNAVRISPGSVEQYFSSNLVTLQINRQISFPAEKTRTFFQHGVPVSSLDHYDSHCNLEIMNRDDDNLQTIEPGNYTITGVSNFGTYVVDGVVDEQSKFHLVRQPLILASADLSVSAMLFSREATDIYLGNHFYLQGKDPNVLRLTCHGAYAPPSEAKTPTLEEIKNSLGDWINIKQS